MGGCGKLKAGPSSDGGTDSTRHNWGRGAAIEMKGNEFGFTR